MMVIIDDDDRDDDDDERRLFMFFIYDSKVPLDPIGCRGCVVMIIMMTVEAFLLLKTSMYCCGCLKPSLRLREK